MPLKMEHEQLTPREGEILRLVAEGQRNREIAQQLMLSCHTVQNHIHNILQKLGVRSRTEAARYYSDNRQGVDQNE